MTQDIDIDRIVYWHRELPPSTVQVVGDGEVEANSGHINLWHRIPPISYAFSHPQDVSFGNKMAPGFI